MGKVNPNPPPGLVLCITIPCYCFDFDRQFVYESHSTGRVVDV